MTDHEMPEWAPFRCVEMKLDRLASNEPTEPLTSMEARAIVERIARARDYFDRTNKDWEDPRWRGAKLFFQFWNTVWLVILFAILMTETKAIPVLTMVTLVVFSLLRLWEDIVDNKKNLADLIGRLGRWFAGRCDRAVSTIQRLRKQ